MIETATVRMYTDSSLDTYGRLYEINQEVLSEEDLVINVFNALLDTMNPLIQDLSQEEYSLLIANMTSIINTLIEIDESDDFNIVGLSAEEILLIEEALDLLANTSPYQLIFIQNFINQLDASDYIDDLALIIEEEDTVGLIILQLEFLNGYIEENASDFASLDIYTDEDLEDLFYDLFVAAFLEFSDLTEIEKTEVLAIIQNNFDFDLFLSFLRLTDQGLNDILDRLDETDYDLLYALYDLQAFYDYDGYIVEDDDNGQDYNFQIQEELQAGQYIVTVRTWEASQSGTYNLFIQSDTGSGEVLLESFVYYLGPDEVKEHSFTLSEASTVRIYTESSIDTLGGLYEYDEDRITEDELVIDLMSALVDTMNPLIQDMTQEEYTVMIENGIQIVNMIVLLDNYHSENYTSDELLAMTLVFDTISETTSEQYSILQTIVNQAHISQIFTQVNEIYYNSSETLTMDELDYGVLIELANLYVDVYDLIESDIDALILDGLSVLDNTVIQGELDISSIDVAHIKTLIAAYPGNLYDQALVVINYDYTNLTPSEILELEELVYWLETPYAD